MQMISSMNLAESRATLLLEDFPDSGSDYDSDDVIPDDAAAGGDGSGGDAAKASEETGPDGSQNENENSAQAVVAAKKKARRKGPCMRRVVVDLTLNAFTNAEAYYEERKAALGKRERTEQVLFMLRTYLNKVSILLSSVESLPFVVCRGKCVFVGACR